MTGPANAGGKQASGQFKPGQSGNPNGKARGTRHKITLLAEKLMQDDAEDVVRAVLAAAKGGDMQASRIIMDRIAPARRDNVVRFALPEIAGPADAVAATAAILRAVADGELTPSEAADIARLVEGFVKTVEIADIDARLKTLEGRAGI